MIEGMTDVEDEGDWVEVRRASTPVEADMVRDFLRDHGVRSAVNGDSGGTRLPWQHTMMDIRIVVSPKDLVEAREVLEANVEPSMDLRRLAVERRKLEAAKPSNKAPSRSACAC